MPQSTLDGSSRLSKCGPTVVAILGGNFSTEGENGPTYPRAWEKLIPGRNLVYLRLKTVEYDSNRQIFSTVRFISAL